MDQRLGRLRRAMGSLKLRLAITGISVIAISVTVTVLLVLHGMEQRGERAAIDSESGHVERLAAVLSSRLVGLQLALRSASEQMPQDSIESFEAMAAFLKSKPVLTSMFANTFIADTQGRIVAAFGSNAVNSTKVSIADRPYFQRTLAESRPVISEPVISRGSNEAIIILTMPVRGPQGHTVAVLGGSLRLMSRTLMSDLTQPGGDNTDPTSTIITDANGHIIAHADKRWVLREAKDDPLIAAAVTQWIAEGRPIEPLGSARRAHGRIVAIAGVPDAEWVVFRSADAEVLLGGPTAGRREALQIGVIVALTGGGIILLAMFIWLRPLRQLEQRALRLLKDDLADEEGWPLAHGEIGELSHAFRHVMQQRATSLQARTELLARMHAVLNTAPVGIAFTRLSRFELVSEQFRRMFGYEEDALVGQPTHLICVSEAAHQALGQRVAAAFAEGRMFDEEMELRRADGSHFWGRRHGAPVVPGDIGSGTIWIVTDVTEAREQRERLSWTATHDPLTDLVNRREFEARLREQLGDRRHTEKATALFIDLDRFKAVNDTAGHAAGDALLKDLANLLTRRVRSNDTVARLGGDEFAVLLRGCDELTAQRVAEQIRARIEAYCLQWNGLSLQVGASIGLVEINDTLPDATAVMAAADAACYAAKRSGRNAVHTHGIGGTPAPASGAVANEVCTTTSASVPA